MRHVFAGLFGMLLLSALSSTSRADFFIHGWDDHHEIEKQWLLTPTFNYYSTSSNYGPTGTATNLASQTTYSRETLDIDAQYGFTDRLTAFARVSWARVNVTAGQQQGATYGFADQTLGLNYRALGRVSPSAMALDLQAQFDFPAYSNANAAQNNSPLEGDSSSDISFGAFGTVPLFGTESGSLLGVAGIGYTGRTNGFSAAIPWSAILEYRRKEQVDNDGFFGSLGLLGADSRDTDTSTTRSAAGSGGSFFVNAINPTIANFRGIAGYQTSPELALLAGFEKSISGSNAPDGLEIFGGVSFRMGRPDEAEGGPRKKTAAQLTPMEYGKSNRGFVQYSNNAARVTVVNDQLSLMKIDRGSDDGVEAGQIYDIFSVSPANSKEIEAIARAKVTDVRANEAALKIQEYFKEGVINPGYIAKRVLE